MRCRPWLRALGRRGWLDFWECEAAVKRVAQGEAEGDFELFKKK
jgi:hypothetical protein